MTRPQKGRARPQRLRPASPGRTFRHLLRSCNALFPRRARETKLIWAVYQVKQFDTIFAGDEKLARLSGQSAKSIQRAKNSIDEEHQLLEIVRTVGGRCRNAKGEAVAAATGYRIRPEMEDTRSQELGELVDQAPGDRLARWRQAAEERLANQRAGP